MSAINIYGIMVIYNKMLVDSKTYECLKSGDVKFVICDNSTVDNDNAETAGSAGVDYISMGGNKGLSVAYNRGIAYICEKYAPDAQDLICFFDDDTMIPESYFKAVQESMGSVLLPVVTDGVGIMSPVLMKGRVAKRFSDRAGALLASGERISGINSGMAVRAGVYENYRYNEEMFLDYIDHMFIIDMRNRGIYPKVVDVEIRQQFSAIEDSKEAARVRFALQKKDLRIFYRGNYAMYLYVIIKKHIKLALKYRDFGMLVG